MKFLQVSVLSLLALTFFGCDSGGSKRVSSLKNDKERVSYVLGLTIGKDFKQQAIDIDPNILAQGMSDALSGSQPLLNDEEVNKTILAFQSQMMEKQQAAMSQRANDMAQQGEKSKKEGQAFLAKNKTQPGVKTTASGLQYKVIKEGKGKSPKATDMVTVHYRGTLVDGTEFDSSYKRNEPATFPLNGVIKGWTEGVQLMKPGAKYQFFIPSDIAYGAEGRPPQIPPNSVLIFEIELLESKAK
jgi:FKBP-type peptidyl-prolyl cis-trans isomerase FklB